MGTSRIQEAEATIQRGLRFEEIHLWISNLNEEERELVRELTEEEAPRVLTFQDTAGVR